MVNDSFNNLINDITQQVLQQVQTQVQSVIVDHVNQKINELTNGNDIKAIIFSRINENLHHYLQTYLNLKIVSKMLVLKL